MYLLVPPNVRDQRKEIALGIEYLNSINLESKKKRGLRIPLHLLIFPSLVSRFFTLMRCKLRLGIDTKRFKY